MLDAGQVEEPLELLTSPNFASIYISSSFQTLGSLFLLSTRFSPVSLALPLLSKMCKSNQLNRRKFHSSFLTHPPTVLNFKNSKRVHV